MYTNNPREQRRQHYPHHFPNVDQHRIRHTHTLDSTISPAARYDYFFHFVY